MSEREIERAIFAADRLYDADFLDGTEYEKVMERIRAADRKREEIYASIHPNG